MMGECRIDFKEINDGQNGQTNDFKYKDKWIILIVNEQYVIQNIQIINKHILKLKPISNIPIASLTSMTTSSLEQVPTFIQNMQNLTKLKQQLLKIHHMFSPNSINYHQLTAVAQLKQQVQLSQKQLTHLQSAVSRNAKDNDSEMSDLKKQKEELEEVNVQLVKCNDKLVAQLEVTSNKLESVSKQLEEQRQARKEMEVKHTREIENLKLMHSQELYILRKKDKKGNN